MARSPLDRLIVFALALVAVLCVGPVADRPMMAAEFVTVGTIIASIGKFLWGLFGGISGKVRTALNALRNSFVTLGGKVAELAAKTGEWFKKVGGLISKFWSTAIRPALAKLYGWVRAIGTTLQRWFGPVIDFLKKIRKHVLKIYQEWIRPILDFISIVRMFFRVAGELGLDWAKDIDRKLGELEDKIRQPFLDVVRKLNEAITWIDRIITLDGLIQRVTLFRTLHSYRREIAGLLLNSSFKPMTSAEVAAYTTLPIKKTEAQHLAELRNAVKFGSGPAGARGREAAQEVMRLLTMT